MRNREPVGIRNRNSVNRRVPAGASWPRLFFVDPIRSFATSAFVDRRVVVIMSEWKMSNPLEFFLSFDLQNNTGFRVRESGGHAHTHVSRSYTIMHWSPTTRATGNTEHSTAWNVRSSLRTRTAYLVLENGVDGANSSDTSFRSDPHAVPISSSNGKKKEKK